MADYSSCYAYYASDFEGFNASHIEDLHSFELENGSGIEIRAIQVVSCDVRKGADIDIILSEFSLLLHRTTDITNNLT